MSLDLNERLVVVTGGGSGIGAFLAREAAGRGAAAVAVLDIDIDSANAVADDLAGTCASRSWQCNVSDHVQLDAVAAAVIDAFGVPALVCANAGVAAPFGLLLDTELAIAEWVFGVNTIGCFNTLQSFGRPMAAGDAAGWLLVTASEHSLGVPHIGGGLYTASKHAVLGLCDVLRRELPAHLGITVLCPGVTDTHLWASETRRPESFGGPGEAQTATAPIFAAGMDPATVARRALDGIEAGSFLVPTHYNTKDYADERLEEVQAAFEALASIDTRRFDPMEIAAQVFRQ